MDGFLDGEAANSVVVLQSVPLCESILIDGNHKFCERRNPRNSDVTPHHVDFELEYSHPFEDRILSCAAQTPRMRTNHLDRATNPVGNPAIYFRSYHVSSCLFLTFKQTDFDF